MPGSLHESLVERFRRRPSLSLEPILKLRVLLRSVENATEFRTLPKGHLVSARSQMPQVKGADDRATQATHRHAEERGRKATPQMGHFRTGTRLTGSVGPLRGSLPLHPRPF